MYDTLLVRHCAPTLAGLKTGCLFSCPFPCREDMRACLRGWNAQFKGKGLHTLPVHCHEGRTLIYVYRSSALLRDLHSKPVALLLRGRGYPLPCPERCIAHLMKQLSHAPTFPHEIGLFLGYPPEDVLGFIRDPSACKYSGCWKVYADVRAARMLFAAYRSCTQTYCARLASGAGLEQLVAAQ